MNTRKLLVIAGSTIALITLTLSSLGWHVEPIQGHIEIRRVNSWETWSQISSNFDLGDDNRLIVSNFGKGLNATNAFACGYPVAIFVYFMLPTNGAKYVAGRLEWCEGSYATNKNDWHLITYLNSNQMSTVAGVPGAHYGLATWYPPKTNNVSYLIRAWAKINIDSNYFVTADLISTNISANGDDITWDDSEVVGIKVIPSKRPGF